MNMEFSSKIPQELLDLEFRNLVPTLDTTRCTVYIKFSHLLLISPFICPFPLSGNTLRVGYHLCIRHILGTVFELYQSSENTHCYFHIIKAKICICHHMQRNIIVF